MDNAYELNAHDFHGNDDHFLAERAKLIREAGWVATRPILDPLVSAADWPPSEEVLSRRVVVALAESDWALVIQALRENTLAHGDRAAADRLEAALRSQA